VLVTPAVINLSVVNVRLPIVRLISAFALVFSLAGQASAILWGYYPLNGNADEATGNNIDLNLVGDTSFGGSVHPGLGGAISFDGAGDGAIGANFNKLTTNDATVVAWAYADSLAGDCNTIIKNWGQTVGGQFHLGLGEGAANTLQNQLVGHVPATAATDFPVGQWVHTAFVLDSVALQHRLYVNGVVVATAPYSGMLGLGGATGLGIGHKPNDNGTGLSDGDDPGPWRGRIDDVGLFNQVLSNAQIQQLYQNGTSGIQLDGTAAPYIGLRVDRANGNVTLRNPTPGPLSFNTYEISSAAGSLNPSEWQDLAGNPGFPTGTGTGNGWEKDAASNEHQLRETFLTGNSSISAGGQISLGNIFRGTEDLSFRFRTASGIVMDSIVEYVGVAPTLIGDYNDDGAVDAADYVVWRDALGQTVSGLAADGNGDGEVDAADYDIWRANFGRTAGGGSHLERTVPEPATLATVLTGVLIMFARQRADVPSTNVSVTRASGAKGPERFGVRSIQEAI
jgi:hypothetical protein